MNSLQKTQKPQKPNSSVTLDYKQRKTRHDDIPQKHVEWKFLQLYGTWYSLSAVNSLKCGHRRYPHSIPLRKLYFDWWLLLIRGRKTLTTLVLKHRKTRHAAGHDIPRSCMIFIVKIKINLLCLVMTFAWKTGSWYLLNFLGIQDT